MLWFAFILLSLSYWKQLNASKFCSINSCDLLSFYYLCRTGNNKVHIMAACFDVVICFHFTIFVVLETTNALSPKTLRTLWFAFILLSLSYWKQLLIQIITQPLGCDLLSFYYLCRTGNNLEVRYKIPAFVVICFHFTIFVVLETTRLDKGTARNCCDLLSFYYLCRTGNNLRGLFPCLDMLWFAFILLSLSYWKQLDVESLTRFPCCDLLSFYYLCRTGNNIKPTMRRKRNVVICFHFTIFVVLETT